LIKKQFIILFFWLLGINSFAQNNELSSPIKEQEIENSTEKNDAETNDDFYWQRLEAFRKHPVDLNMAEETDLEDLQLLTGLQVQNFLSYRRIFGKFLSIYELQSIPGWDINTIKNVLSFVTVNNENFLQETLKQRWKQGNNSLLVRVSQQIEKAHGYFKPTDSSSYYLGSPQKIFFRYKYEYKNLMQFGLLGDKDAGEQFFRGAQKYGFDFYSIHFFTKNIGIIKSLALGDFTVNLGQGLIQWQSLAFTKSADVLAIKRQSAVLRPYNSSGEFNFHRGAGITLYKKNWEITVFGSFRKISANLVADTLKSDEYVSSFESSGYHRTSAEIADRNILTQIAFGGNLVFVQKNYRVGINMMNYRFSKNIQKQDLPYNLFSLQGKTWNNESIDYGFVFQNIHFFGETAVDKNFHYAMVNGALISVAPVIDVSFIYRNISSAYQSLYANAFTENTAVNNEKGFYSGISIHPFAGWSVEAYVDIYKFPWLKYQVDAPGSGRDYFIQLEYKSNKNFNIYTRYKNESKNQNLSDLNFMTHHVVFIPKQDWRTEMQIRINKKLELRNRIELLWYDRDAADYEQGFTILTDFFYSPFLKSVSGNLRLQYFETDGYNSRIYVYENDVLYNYSIPAFYGKGFRYYINLNYNFKKLSRNKKLERIHIEAWLRWSQTIYANQNTLGSGLDEIQGNRKSEIKFQTIFGW